MSAKSGTDFFSPRSPASRIILWSASEPSFFNFFSISDSIRDLENLSSKATIRAAALVALLPPPSSSINSLSTFLSARSILSIAFSAATSVSAGFASITGAASTSCLFVAATVLGASISVLALESTLAVTTFSTGWDTTLLSSLPENIEEAR